VLARATEPGVPTPPGLFTYRARVDSVTDGDTLVVAVDAGFRIVTTHQMRLLGVNTPEVRGGDAVTRAKAQAATAFVVKWCAEHADHLAPGLSRAWPLTVRTEKSDAFGRWLADVRCGAGHELAAALLEAGLAVPYARKRAG
jgi:endonuclease YncB( thermonuclease family)